MSTPFTKSMGCSCISITVASRIGVRAHCSPIPACAGEGASPLAQREPPGLLFVSQSSPSACRDGSEPRMRDVFLGLLGVGAIVLLSAVAYQNYRRFHTPL